jgi:hypothetical protein
MGSPLRRLVRLGLPAVAVLAAALTGCGDPAPVADAPAPDVPSASAPTPVSPSAPPSPSSSSSRLVPPVTGTTGSDGLTVRHLDADGTVRSVPVEDFRTGR